MKQEKLIYILLVVVALFNVSVSTYILINQYNGQLNRKRENTSIQKSTDRVTCILLIQPADRTTKSIKECEK